MAWFEIALLMVLAVQLARLVWAVATPVGPFGAWRPPMPVALGPAARTALLARFDPFFRAGSGATGPAAVTSLSLTLYGIRLNEASGQGSAIIAGPDGVQSSVSVGDEVTAGVRLKAVAIDHVVLDRGGVAETLYLDQSGPAPTVSPPAVPSLAAPGAQAPAQFNAPPAAAAPANALRDQFAFAPRLAGGSITGVTIGPRGDGAAFRRTGLRDGDVVVRVDGKPIGSIADAQALEGRLSPGTQLSIAVERGGQTIPLTLSLPR